MVDITTIINAALAPLSEPTGWQGLAYGLLGLKTTKRMFHWARGLGRRKLADEDNSEA